MTDHIDIRIAVGDAQACGHRRIDVETQAVSALLDAYDKLLAAQKPTKAAKDAIYPEPFFTAYGLGLKWRQGSTLSAAYKAWKARIAAGADPDAITAGVIAYAKHCEATGREKMMAQTFFGPGEHYTADWSIPTQARAGAQTAPSSKFNFAGVDRSGDKAAQAASMARHGIVATDGEVDL